MLDKDMEE